MRIEQYLKDSAARDGAQTAIVSGDVRLSYARFLDLATRMATTLHTRGVERGDRVLILLDNGWQTAVAVLATWIAGAVICPVNPAAKSTRLAQIARDCTPALVFVEGRLERLLDETPEIAATPRIVAGGGFEAALDAAPLIAAPLPDTDLAALIYTSGSTGEPKGVMLAH
ncbi:MAG: AMP-dependent synthetase, partial [Stutzerimonas stutzeri]